MNRTMKNLGITLTVIQGAVKCILLTCCMFIAFFSLVPIQAAVIVENPQAFQRPGAGFQGGSRYVDISYDVSGTTYPLVVSVLISNDDGVTWDVVPTTDSLSGDVGVGLLAGTGKKIEWDAGTDRPKVYWEVTQARVIATELLDSIVVSPTPTKGTWSLAGPEGFEGNGQTFEGKHVFLNAQTGSYTLTCNALDGYTTPTSETQFMVSGGWLKFVSFWERESITIVLPDSVTTMTLMSIPKGSFMMGSPDDEQGSYDDARPQHEVTLANDFFIGKFEVTKAQWITIMGTTPWIGREYVSPDMNSPATYMSWHDINGPEGFLDKLNERLGTTEQTFRLPTEAEWEYACRAGTTTRFYWGDDLNLTEIDDYAWWGGYPDGFTHVVGGKLQNAWGLHDMSGNAIEWCQDKWHSNYDDAPSDGSAWESGTSPYRMARGGVTAIWRADRKHYRSAVRSASLQYLQTPEIGFRVVRSQTGTVGGTISINVTPNTGSWVLSGPGGYQKTGSGDRLGENAILAPLLGEYTLTYDDMAGYTTPPSKTQSLSPGTWIGFNPSWTPDRDGYEEITISLPGNVPMVLVRIPAGTFLMGSPDGEKDREEDEGPQHEVTLTQDYYMGKFEVTKAQWTAVMGVTIMARPNSEELLDPDAPAYRISWNDINRKDGFLDRLNKHLGTTGQPYRLPTEAEWEYACRGNETARFYWGDDPAYTEIKDYAWWIDNTWRADEKYFHYAAQKLPNAWGLYDMSGNVMEWCQDWYGNYSSEAQTDPTGPVLSTVGKVARGGSCNSYDKDCRSAVRSYSGNLDSGSEYHGFRIMRTIPMAGSISIDVTPDTGSWVLSGPDGYEESGTGDRLRGSALSATLPGEYTLTCADLTSHTKPLMQSQTLVSGGALSFEAAWRVRWVGDHTVTITLPDNVTTMTLVKIPKGTFMMGSPAGEQDRDSNEGPQHEVTLTHDFYMGKFEVTKAQWIAVMGNIPWQGAQDVSHEINSPAIGIRWYDITDTDGFMERLNEHLSTTELPFRLPTEAEWEYACRANTITRFYWGDDPNYEEIDAYAWWGGNTVEKKQTQVVGQKLPNAWGLFDMSGNVQEWCEDPYANYSSDPQTDPIGSSISSYHRVARGGDWESDGVACRSAKRLMLPRTNGLGFRVVRTLPTGIISIDVTPDTGSWALDGPEGYHETGIGDRLGESVISAISPGEYTLTCNDLTSHTKPSVQSQTLPPAGSISFEAIWRTQWLDGDALTIILPDGVTTLTLTKIPKGTFMMGSPDDEQDRDNVEGPQHEVTLTHDFYMGKFEVTKAQWTAVTGTESWSGKSDVLDHPDSPAVYITYGAAVSFLGKLNEHLGTTEYPYRLPTEAEWEYACRAGTTTRFYWGDDPNHMEINDYAWWKGNAYSVGEDYAHVVGKKLPNAWGLYDMNGNVSEWCRDVYGAYSAEPQENPIGPPSGSARVVRSSSWKSDARVCRSAKRSNYLFILDFTKPNTLGFRIVQTLPTLPVGSPISINVAPDMESWSPYGYEGYEEAGTGNRLGESTLSTTLPGEYTLTCNDLVGYTLPSAQSQALALNGSRSMPLPETGMADTTSFTLDTRPLLFTLHTESEHGHIIKEPNLELYEYGTIVTLIAVPESGFIFVEWTGDVPDDMKNLQEIELVIEEHKAIEAMFRIRGLVPAVWKLR